MLKNIVISAFLFMFLLLNQGITLSDDLKNEEIISLPENQTPNACLAGDNTDESDRLNGLDDDSDGLTDEGKNLGSCMIIISNTNDEPDDSWDLRVDGHYQGRYEKGKARFWDLMLPAGKHIVTVEQVDGTDTTGNYSIQFLNCTKTKGSELDPFSDSQQQQYTWEINVPQN